MTNYIVGKNPLLQALQSEKPIHRIMISRQLKTDEKIRQIQATAEYRRIPIMWVDPREIDKVSHGENHQGILAYVPAFQYVEVEDILDYAEQLNQPPLIIMLDEIEDPYNFGSLIRSAVGAGVHGIIIPNKKQVEVTPTVVKVSTGATTHIRIARVSNLAQTAEQLKKKGVWIVGTHQEGSRSYLEMDFSIPLALIIGNEGKGMSRLLKEKCDFLIHIPMATEVLDSLNASVAGAIIMFKIHEQRG